MKDDFIRSEDFNSIRIEVSMMNSTTKTQLAQGRRTFRDHEEVGKAGELDIQVVEFSSQGLTVEVPSKSGAQGHFLILNLKTSGANPDTMISAVGRIEEVIKLEKNREQFVVSLVEFDPVAWMQLTKVFSSRQDAINEFLAGTRG